MTKAITRAVAHPPASVLVAEDDVWFCETIAWALEASGYVAHRASSASEALEVAASGAQIDLLLTDVVMPDMGGVELADQIHARRPDLPVIFMSGYAESELHEHGLLPPEAPSLQKPFRLEELEARIEDTVHSRSGDPGDRS